MKEDFLHYVWKFQKFTWSHLETVRNESLQIVKVGVHNFDSGPDFLLGQIVLGNTLWVGHIEIHIRSSQWYAHGHEQDPGYDNVILHVVWEHDREVFRSDETRLPTLELKHRVDKRVLDNYFNLFGQKPQWIQCGSQLGGVPQLLFENWMDRMFLERLEQRSERIDRLLVESKNHWEYVLFLLLSRSFGLAVNGDSFFSIAQSIPFAIIRKCRHDLLQIEALLMGQAGLLDQFGGDPYYEEQRKMYRYLITKYSISKDSVSRPRFFRLRPNNFPTIRLSQLAVLWHSRTQLFSDIISVKHKDECYRLFKITASKYWDTHYNFGVPSAASRKRLTISFMDLLILNVIIPLQYCYARKQGKDSSEEIIGLAMSVKAEKNNVTKRFSALRKLEGNALESQALLQLKNEYCNKRKCMHCAIGNYLLKR